MNTDVHDDNNVKRRAFDAALGIGFVLSEAAIWDDSKTICNWMGRGIDVRGSPGLGSAVSVAIGPDLYGGTAGIALCLAELYQLTKEPRFKKTAVAALRRSMRYLERYPKSVPPLSFFNGHLGVACVADRLSRNVPEEDLHADALRLFDHVFSTFQEPHYLDVIGGSAGAVPPLLALARRDGYERYLDLALRCGEELCKQANWVEGVCSWDPKEASGFECASPLGGLSHGASGIAIALVELFAETGDTKYLETARGAFAYEDTLFSDREQNWLDVRFPHATDKGSLTGSFPTAWCHGAPGIALARIRASQIDMERTDSYLDTIRIAIATTAKALEGALALERCDVSMCHGMTGLAEILLIASQKISGISTEHLLFSNITKLVETYGGLNDWPSGFPGGGPNPSLMMGMTGVAYHFLRLASSDNIPSILVS